MLKDGVEISLETVHSEPKKITVDITALMSRNRITGIQRVVFDVLRAGWSDGICGVRFSRQTNQMVHVAEIPRLAVSRPDKPGRARPTLYPLVDRLWAVLATNFAGTRLLDALSNSARWFHSKFLSKYSWAEQEDSERWSVPPPDSLYLLDVPTTRSHLETLKSLVADGTQLNVYLYDVMPTKTGESWAADLNVSQRELFAEFMDLVLRAHSVTCLSQFTRDEYLDFRREKVHHNQKLTVMYPPLSLEAFSARDYPVKKSVASWDVTEFSLNVMAVAPLLRRKNLRTVFAALQQICSLPERKVALRLVCPASASIDGEAWDRLQDLRKRDNIIVEFHRDISDRELNILYHLADVVVVPSLYEGLGLPILEALSSGTCVLASDIPAFRELRQHSDFTLVQSDSPEEWASALLSIRGKCRPQSTPNFLPSPEEFLSHLSGVGS